MKLETLLSIWPIVLFLLTQLVLATVAWTKLTGKVKELGEKCMATENRQNLFEQRMDRMDREVAEYRRDTQEATKAMARMEKGMDELRRSQEIGFRELEKSMTAQELENSNRLTRIETIAGMRRASDIAQDGAHRG